MMRRSNLKIVASQPPEALLAHRLSEVQAAWATLLMFPYVPQSFFAWVGACDRLEAERLRAVRGWRK
jgi:hypothetical protein